jgi:hypothetical protein
MAEHIMNGLAAEWRKELLSKHDWQLDTQKPPSCGELSGVWLKPRSDAPFGAYLKPTTYVCTFPAAAKEKIAADLAYDLGLSVAPVLLCDSQCRFGAVQNECCVSLVTHAETPPWGVLWTEAVQSSPVGAAIRKAAAEFVSNLRVFDIWIGNRDRNNAENVVFGEDRESPSRSGFVGLDHSRSMGASDSWANDGWKMVTTVPFPSELHGALDVSVMLRFTERIEGLADETVVRCVKRIPDAYLDSDCRDLLVEGLVSRKSLVRAFVLQNI